MKSLRLRLLLATAVVTLCAIAVVDVVTYALVTKAQIRQVDAALDRAHSPVELVASSQDPNDRLAIPTIAPGLFVFIVRSDGNVEYESGANQPGRSEDQLDTSAITSADRRQTVQSLHGVDVRVRVDPLDNGSTLVIGESLHEVNETRATLLTVLVTASVAAVGIATALAWWLLRAGLRPLRRVETSAAAITDSDLAERRVPGADEPSEVGRLAAALNAMLDRLQAARAEREQSMSELTESEARMRRFVADASHELRTPIAATAAYAELFERGARNHPDDLERAMTGIRSETTRMGALVDDLLLLARLDEKRPMRSGPVDLTEIVLASVDAARTLAEHRVIRPHVDDVIVTMGDPVALRQVVDNLLANVRAHTPSPTECDITLRRSDDTAELVVADTGPGVDDISLPRLFDRFYRVDDARARTTGGSGLGLSIVAAIVEAHNGSITAKRNEPNGLVVTVRLPTAPLSLDATNFDAGVAR